MGRPDAPVGVVHVITKLDVGGAQEMAMAICAGLPADGWSVQLAAGVDRGVGGDSWREAERRGIRTHELRRLVRDISPVADVLAVAELRRWLRRERPAIVQTHSSKAGIIGRMAARLARVPVIVHTVHGWSFRDYQGRAQRRVYVALERMAARWSSAIVVVAESDRGLGLGAGIGRADQYHVLPTLVDVAALAPDPGRRHQSRSRLELADDELAVLTVTRFAYPKDGEGLLRAWAEVAAAEPRARLLVAGDGPGRAEIEGLVSSLGIGESVSLLGVRRDVADLLAAADVFVLCSRSEGLPKAVMEALAAGVPVVASAVGGLPDIIDDGESGRLVPAGDPGAMAKAILELTGDEPSRARLAAAGQAVAAGHDAPALIGRLAGLYDELLASSVEGRG